MAEIIDRSYPGELTPGTGDTFRNTLNDDREGVYGHTQALEAMIELFATDLCGSGTMPSNTAECYIDNPVVGRVYCEVGYKAIIGAAVETTVVISQEYIAAAINYVFLSLSVGGILSLRVDPADTPFSNDILIASISAAGVINNWPENKIFAHFPPTDRVPAGDVTVPVNHSMMIAGDYEIASAHVLELLNNSIFEIT